MKSVVALVKAVVNYVTNNVAALLNLVTALIMLGKALVEVVEVEKFDSAVGRVVLVLEVVKEKLQGMGK